MDETGNTTKQNIPRMGFHYYQDTVHYTEKDLSKWLPELEKLGAAWLVLRSEPDRAIPETFVRGLLQANIEPMIQISLPLPAPADTENIKPVLEAYSHWGVRYIQLFDRPNLSSSWLASAWFQEDLVERFLDRFVPLAGLTNQLGMTPIFPALEPGGSYWDTAFLRSALESLERRKETAILEEMAISAYAYTFSKPLDWGAGGPESWPSARPYHTPDGTEDQRGFRIADWYSSIAKSVLGKELPIFLFGVGLQQNPQQRQAEVFPPDVYASFILEIASSIAGADEQKSYEPGDTTLPVNSAVKAACFWLLAEGAESKFASFAWFPENENPAPVVAAVEKWAAENSTSIQPKTVRKELSGNMRLTHYLLLPTYEWGVADWHLDVIRPYVKKYQPTIGFSLEEAALAEQVTVIGNTQAFPEADLDLLRQNGCSVERISGDGTSIATQLAER